MGKRLFATIASLGLLVGLIAGVVGAGTAGAETPPGSQSDLIFFPWVPNGETLNNGNTWYGSIVVQNLEDVPINLQLGLTAGGVFPISAKVRPHASYTFSAADLATQLGWTGKGGGVVAAATWDTSNPPSNICQPETGSITAQRDDDAANLPPTVTKTADVDYLAGLPLGATVTGISQGTNTYDQGTDWTQSGNLITWKSSNRPANDSLYQVTYTTLGCTRGPQIGGVEKQAAPTNSGFLVNTDSSMTSVDGYTAIPDTDVAWGVSSTFCQKANPSGVCNNLGGYALGWPVSGFDGHSYLPIVQGAYSGWETILHVTNVDASTPNGGGAVTITYYQQGQGAGNTAAAASQFTLKAGESKTINLSNVVPAGFVGSAWITSQYGVVVSSSRVKGTMALTNTNVPSIAATTSPDNGSKNKGDLGVAASCSAIDGTMCQMYAPLVYLDYNGWNTGFNIVNTSEVLNQVTVNVVNRAGTSVGVFTAAVPPKGMQYVYIPAGQDKGLGQGDFTAAILTGNAPFNATVDEVKYSTGDAMSYNATATLAVAPGHGFDSRFFGNTLSLPLYQAGNVTGGVSHGDTSGINLFNPTGDLVSGRVDFYMSTGAAAGSTMIGGGTPFTLGAMSSALVAYAPSQPNITPGSQLSAVVTVTSGHGGVVGVSNEVNYDVNGDGGVVFNMLNTDGQYRYPCSQTSCGSPVPPVGKFASKLTLEPATQSHIVGVDASVTATAYDANGAVMPNVNVTFNITSSGSPSATSPIKMKTDVNGQAVLTYTNTQAGTDKVSATAKAPNGQTLASVPPTVDVIWTQPTLNVQVCTISGDTCTADNPDVNNTTTVTADANNQGSWKYTFTVTGVATPADLNDVQLHFTPSTGSTFGSEGYFVLTDLDPGKWTCVSGTCTATLSANSIDITNRIGKSEILDWYLDINGDGTQQAYEPNANDNPTTVIYKAATPTFAVSVTSSTTTPDGWFAETVAQGQQVDDSPNATVVAYPATLTDTSAWDGNWTWTFITTGVPCADLSSGAYQVAYDAPTGGGSPGTVPSNQLTWQADGSSCIATLSASGYDVTSLLGMDSVTNWTLVKASDQSTVASGNATKLHVVGLEVKVSPGNAAEGQNDVFENFGQSVFVDENTGPSWEYKFTAYGFTADELNSALLQWHYFPQNSYFGAQDGSYGPASSSATSKILSSWDCSAGNATKQQCTATAATVDFAGIQWTQGFSLPVSADWYLDLNADGNRNSTTEPIGDQTKITIVASS